MATKETNKMKEIVITIISIISSISAIIFAYLAFKRNENNDIGYIKSCIERMEKKLDNVEINYQKLLTRIIKLEEKNN